MEEKRGKQLREIGVFEPWQFKILILLDPSITIENVGINREWNPQYGWLCNHEFNQEGICEKCKEGSITKVVKMQSTFHIGHTIIDWETIRNNPEYLKTLQAIKDSCDMCPPNKATYCNLCNPYDDLTEEKSRCDFCLQSREDINMQYLQLYPVQCYECDKQFGIGDYVCHILVVNNNRKTGYEIRRSIFDGSKFEILCTEEYGVCRKCAEINRDVFKTPLYQIDKSKPIGKIPQYDVFSNKWKIE